MQEESILSRIMRRFRTRMAEHEKPLLTVRLNEKEITALGWKSYLMLVEAGQLKKYNNDYSTRLDRRPPDQGGLQLHILHNHSPNQWAYRDTGARSEPSRFTAPSTRMVQQIVRDVFQLGKDVQIESQVLDTENEQGTLICEASFKKASE